MASPRTVLLVDSDAACGRALAVVLRRQGDRVRVVSSRSQALQAIRRDTFDLAIVDLFVGGGGFELAREIARRVPHLMLSLGASLAGDEVVEAALGFRVCRKSALPTVLRARGVSSNGAPSVSAPAVPRPRRVRRLQ